MDNGIVLTRLRSLEPDCVVVVGKQRFRHHKALLCEASPFFDALFSVQPVCRFPDLDPNEWRTLIYPSLLGGAVVAVVPSIYPWLHLLQASRASAFFLLAARAAFSNNQGVPWQDLPAWLDLCHVFPEANAVLQQDVMKHVAASIRRYPNLWLFLWEHVSCKSQLLHETIWNEVIAPNLPSHLRENDPKDLIQNPLFGEYVHSKLLCNKVMIHML